jgi:hypothetical protein
LRLGFKVSAVDHALFHYSKEWKNNFIHCLLAMHVDNGAGSSNLRPFLEWVKDEIRKEFGIKDLGPIRRFLGMQIKRDHQSRTLWIHQGEYITSILTDYKMQDCNAVHNPMDSSFPFSRPGEVFPEVPDILREYQKIVRSLLYLVLCTRPDLAHIVGHLSQFCSCPLPCHYATAKHILQYLKGTQHY